MFFAIGAGRKLAKENKFQNNLLYTVETRYGIVSADTIPCVLLDHTAMIEARLSRIMTAGIVTASREIMLDLNKGHMASII